MTRPYFSIAIPTKNRPDQVADAVRSVLDQTFDDLEIVVCDNSDESETAATADIVHQFEDERVRYVRTSGRLSMPDNWERAIADARGEYVGILTDRSVFGREALSVVRGEIERSGATSVSWFNDLYGRDKAGQAFKRRESTFRRHRLESRNVLDCFVNGDPKFSPKIIPKLMTSVCHRSVLDAIRASPVGRCCPPVAPDFTSGFLILAHSEWVLILDEALYVSSGYGNGAAFRRRTELGDQFRDDLGMTWTEMVDRMPTEACFSYALVLNDLMRIRDAVPERLDGVRLNRVQYYIGCLTDYVKVARHGVTARDEDFDVLLEGLVQERFKVRREVEASSAYRKSCKYRARQREKLPLRAAARIKAQVTTTPPPSFATVFDALRWDEQNPRKPVDESFVDRLLLDRHRKRDNRAHTGIGSRLRELARRV